MSQNGFIGMFRNYSKGTRNYYDSNDGSEILDSYPNFGDHHLFGGYQRHENSIKGVFVGHDDSGNGVFIARLLDNDLNSNDGVIVFRLLFADGKIKDYFIRDNGGTLMDKINQPLRDQQIEQVITPPELASVLVESFEITSSNDPKLCEA
jgi:hypothetical protein